VDRENTLRKVLSFCVHKKRLSKRTLRKTDGVNVLQAEEWVVTNTLAYLASSSVTKKNGLTFTSGVIVINISSSQRLD